MIVKNEEHVIQRSLASILPFVDTWCIVDTGSTDTTINLITQFSEKPGKLYERPWVNFGHNRTEALELARPLADWLFMLDADDIYKGTTEFPQLSLGFDAYSIELQRGNLHYYRPVLFNSRSPWVYVGALHEYATIPTNSQPTIEPLPTTYYIDARVEGARSKNPTKYKDDALMLEQELETTPTSSRAAFYCAQSWRDSGNSQKAIQWYITASTMTTAWYQERYISYLNLIRLVDTMNIPSRDSRLEEKLKYGWKALEICPGRLEAAHSILEFCRKQNVWNLQVYALALMTVETLEKRDTKNELFTDPDVYTYKFYDEFSIYSFYTNHKRNAFVYGQMALSNIEKSHPDYPRILSNMEFYTDKP
jgi:glycosyltransferase involved in cell wall biosynthesis